MLKIERYKIMISEKNAKLFCKDDISLIENYDIAVNDKTIKWVVHHRRGTIYSREGLKEIGEYYKRPAIELIFMTDSEHRKLHSIGNKNCLGKHHSEEAKEKMSKSKVGNNNPFFGKHHSENTRKKMSKSQMGNHNKPTKPILQYTKDGEFIKEWVSGTEASRVLGINNGHIVSCCKGKLKSAGGFVWRYR